MKRNCKRCGKFFSDPDPYFEYCGYVCWSDDKAEKERWDRMRDENLAALRAMADGTCRK